MSGAAIIMKQNRLMRNFRTANATSPALARMPEDIGCRQRWIFRRMAARGVFVPVGDGKFYMDEEAARNFVQLRRGRALITLLILGIGLALYLLWHCVNH
jgi:hypothetical protein